MNCTQMDRYLDRMMDSELSDDELRIVEDHCRGCADCAEKLKVNREMMRVFSEMAPEIDVPLQTQAAWRGAIKREAGKTRQKMFMRYAGGIAAAMVVALIATFALRAPSKDAANLRAMDAAPAPEPEMAEEYAMADDARIETDGAADMEEYEAFGETADEAPLAMNMLSKAAPAAAAAPMHEIDMVVEDVDRVCDYARDLAQEYAGDIDIQRFDEDGVSCANLYIDLPQANAAEFFEAIRHFDRSDAGLEGYDVNGETSMLLVLRSE